MNRRDIEHLSAYLDGELKPSDLTKLEARLKTDPELASVLSDLRSTRALLRKLPSRKAPRSFKLTRQMVGQNPPLPRAYPIFRLATVVATLLFFFSFGINSFSSQTASQTVGFGMGGGGSVAEQAPALEAPAAPAPTEPKASADSTATEVSPEALAQPQAAEAVPSAESSLRAIATPSSKADGTENAVGPQQVQIPQEAPPLVSSTWQIGFVIVALVGILFMMMMRYIAVRRWK
jgi:anti-sigma factor RsiW